MPQPDLGRIVTRKHVAIGSAVHKDEAAISHEQVQQLTDDGLERVEVESLGTCSGCGALFHQVTEIAGVCICGAVLCAKCATVHCADPSCLKLLCPSCRNSWGSGFLCHEHMKARALAYVLLFIVVVAVLIASLR